MLSVAITIVLGRGLLPADFGFVALVSSLFAIAMVVLDMGTDAVATREVAAHPEKEREMLAALLALRRILATLVLAIVLVVALSDYLVHGRHRIVLVVAAIGLYLLHFNGYQVAYQVRQSYGQVVMLGLAGQAAFLFASIGVLALKWGGGAIAMLVVLREASQALCVRWVGMRLLRERIVITWEHPGIRPLLKAGWLIGIAGVCYKLALYAGGFLLWGLASPEAVASFHAAQRLLVPAGDMAWIFVMPLIASMGAAIAGNTGAFRLQLEGHAKFLLGVGAQIAVAGFFVAPFLLNLLYGERYSTGTWSSVVVLRWLAVGYLFALVTPVLVVGELARGNARALMRVGIAVAALNISLNTFAVPAYGAEGAAMVQCAGEAFVFAILMARCLARGDMRLGSPWVAYLVPAALLGVVLYSLEGWRTAQFVAACAWAPASLFALLRLPAQRASRASLAGSVP